MIGNVADEPEPKATAPMGRRDYNKRDEPKSEEVVVQHDEASNPPLELGDKELAEKKRFPDLG